MIVTVFFSLVTTVCIWLVAGKEVSHFPP